MKTTTNATINYNTTTQEETLMRANNEVMEAAINEINVKVVEGMEKNNEGIKGFAGVAKKVLDGAVQTVVSGANKTKEQYVNENQESANTIMGAVVDLAAKTADVLGYNVLRDDLYGIIEAGGERGSLFLMAEDLRKRIDNEIELLIAWGDEESFKKAIQLEALTKDERGKSIFESLIAGLIWIGKWMAKKLRQWFQVDNEKSLLGALCRSLSVLASVLREGVKLLWSTTKYIFSFPAALLIKVSNWILTSIKSLFEKVKGWFAKKDEKVEEEDFDDFEDIEVEFVTIQE